MAYNPLPRCGGGQGWEVVQPWGTAVQPGPCFGGSFMPRGDAALPDRSKSSSASSESTARPAAHAARARWGSASIWCDLAIKAYQSGSYSGWFGFIQLLLQAPQSRANPHIGSRRGREAPSQVGGALRTRHPEHCRQLRIGRPCPASRGISRRHSRRMPVPAPATP